RSRGRVEALHAGGQPIERYRAGLRRNGQGCLVHVRPHARRRVGCHRVYRHGAMSPAAPISFARGAPSLDIIAVEDLRAAADRAFQKDPQGTFSYGTSGGYAPLRDWIAEYHDVERE